MYFEYAAEKRQAQSLRKPDEPNLDTNSEGLYNVWPLPYLHSLPPRQTWTFDIVLPSLATAAPAPLESGEDLLG